MTKRLIAWLLITCSLLVSGVSAAELKFGNPFGEPEEWTVSQEYIDDVFKYDMRSLSGAEEVISGSYGKYDSEIRDILMLGIMQTDENGAFNSEGTVSERELAQILDVMFFNGSFDGMYTGTSDKEKVKISTAAEAFVDSLGYELEARHTGYMALAAKKGLTKGLSIEADGEYITREQMAKLAHNALTIPISVAVYSGNSTEYYVDKSRTVLNEVLEAVEVKGFLNGVYGINLLSGVKAFENEVLIDEVRYIYKTDCSELLGKRVTGYARIDSEGGVKELIGLREDSRYPSITYDITEDMEIIESGRMEFKDSEGKTDTYSVASIRYLNYNGDNISTGELVTKINNVKAGTVTFAQTEGNGVYNAAVIKDYSTYLVSGISIRDTKIYPSYGLKYQNNKTAVEFAEGATVNIYNAEGKRTAFEEIKAKDVVSVYSNSDGSYGEIIVSGKKLTGKIETQSNSGGATVYKIGNEFVKASEEYGLAVSNTANNLSVLTIGLEGTFYISFDGRIAGFARSSGGTYMGYMKAYGSVGGSIDEKYAIKVFTQDGLWKVYNIANKLTLDGVKGKSASDVPEHIEKKTNDEMPAGAHPIIRYKLNSNDEIVFLDTLYTSEAEADDKDRMRFEAKITEAPKSGGGFSWVNAPYHCVNSTKILAIPKDMSEERKYEFVNTGYITGGGEIVISFYNADDFMCAAFAVLDSPEENPGKRYKENYLMIVDRVITNYDFDDEEEPIKYSIEGRRWSSKVESLEWELSKTFFDSDTNEMPVEGGVYKIIESGSEMRSMLRVGGNGVVQPDVWGAKGDAREEVSGEVTLVGDTMINIKVRDVVSSIRIGNAAFMMYDSETGKTEEIDKSEVLPGDRIHVYGSVGTAGAIFISR